MPSMSSSAWHALHSMSLAVTRYPSRPPPPGGRCGSQPPRCSRIKRNSAAAFEARRCTRRRSRRCARRCARLATLHQLDRRSGVEDGERLLLFFTMGVHHAIVAIECVDGVTSFMHLCSLGRPLPANVEATLARFGARDQMPRGCPRQENGLDCGFFVLALARYVVALTTPLSTVRRIQKGTVDKVTDAYMAQQREWLRGLSEE